MDDFGYILCAILLVLFVYTIWSLMFTDCDFTLAVAEKYGRTVSQYEGKVVWVTGASTGLGEAMAYELASVGVKLVLSARSENLLVKVRDECIEKSRGKLSKEDILILPFDIAKLECHQENVDKAVNHFGKIDVLMNNAARYQVGESIKTENSVDKAVFDVNYFGPVSLTKLMVKHFLAQKEGHIAVVSSIAGKFGIPSTASYCGTKHALQGYFEALRMEYKRYNITVTIVNPGIFTSSIFEKAMTTSTDQMLHKEHYKCVNMSTERCAHLTLVATANKLYESWVAFQPFLLMLWGAQYAPDIQKYLMSLLYTKRRIKELYQGNWPNDLPVWRPFFSK